MDLKYIFLDSNGRIGVKEFWIGFLILFGAAVVLGWIPLIGQLISILLIYPWICLYSKRLHDFGKTGWLVLVPFGIGVAAMVLSFVVGGASIFAAGMSGTEEGVATSALAGMGVVALLLGVAALVGFAFLLWVGLSKGDAGPNKYGPPYGGAAASTPTAA